MRRWLIGATMVLLFCPAFADPPLRAASSFADPAFLAQWHRGEAITPNFWGPLATASASVQEPYAQAAGDHRLVQYFDKGRMELTNGAVTSGLLATEMISGKIQIGEGTFTDRPAPAIAIAGDADNLGPTYAGLAARGSGLFSPAASVPPASRFASTLVATRVAADGTPTSGPPPPNTGEGQTALAAYDPTTQHNLPQAFAEYRNRAGLATIGLALSEPFLTTVRVGGVPREVMVQVFERRVLTYTAANPSGFMIEMGNIGTHYYQWRYGSLTAARATPAIAPSAARAQTAGQAATYNWPTFSGVSRYVGNNDQETVLTPANVGGLHRLFQSALPAIADGVPVLLGGVATPAGTKDLLFVTTRAGQIVALDAHDGTQIWQHAYGPGDCRINGGATACYTTSSPAIDPNKRFVYSYGLDGYVHKYAVGDGTESSDGGWPELATRKGSDEKGSSALNIATAKNGTSYLYVAHAGYPGDRGDYQGHLTTINLADGSQHVFNAACSDQADVHFSPGGQGPDCDALQTAIWVRQGVVYNPDTDKIYTVTGNGQYDGAHNWGESVLALNPDGTGANGGPLDAYTPPNFAALTSRDTDLGSTAPVVLPPLPNSAIAHLAVQGGKDAKVRLLNLDDLSGQGGPGHTGGEIGPLVDVSQGGQVLTAPAVWINPADQSVSVCQYAAEDAPVIRDEAAPSLRGQTVPRAPGRTPVPTAGTP